MKRLPTWARYTLCVLVLAFAMMGATHAVHESAKAFYGVLNAAAGAGLVATWLGSRRNPV